MQQWLTEFYIAYAHAMEQRVKYVGDILQALLVARKKKWDEGELARIERESEIFKYVKGLLEKERKERLAAAGEDEEKIDEVNYIQVQNLLDLVLAISIVLTTGH